MNDAVDDTINNGESCLGMMVVKKLFWGAESDDSLIIFDPDRSAPNEVEHIFTAIKEDVRSLDWQEILVLTEIRAQSPYIVYSPADNWELHWAFNIELVRDCMFVQVLDTSDLAVELTYRIAFSNIAHELQEKFLADPASITDEEWLRACDPFTKIIPGLMRSFQRHLLKAFERRGAFIAELFNRAILIGAAKNQSR